MKNVLTFDLHGTEVLFYKSVMRDMPAITIAWWASGPEHGSITLTYDTPDARDADFACIDEARACYLVDALLDQLA